MQSGKEKCSSRLLRTVLLDEVNSSIVSALLAEGDIVIESSGCRYLVRIYSRGQIVANVAKSNVSCG